VQTSSSSLVVTRHTRARPTARVVPTMRRHPDGSVRVHVCVCTPNYVSADTSVSTHIRTYKHKDNNSPSMLRQRGLAIIHVVTVVIDARIVVVEVLQEQRRRRRRLVVRHHVTNAARMLSTQCAHIAHDHLLAWPYVPLYVAASLTCCTRTHHTHNPPPPYSPPMRRR
jgi:hypothetical protein